MAAGPFGGDGAGVEDVGPVGHLEGLRGQLLDQQDGGALRGQLADDVEDLGPPRSGPGRATARRAAGTTAGP